jgi:hypothetical protein
MVAGSFGAGDRLGVQLSGPGRVDGVDGQEIPEQAPGQQDVVAEPPGTLDRFLPERASCRRLAGEETRAHSAPRALLSSRSSPSWRATWTACSASCRAVASQ